MDALPVRGCCPTVIQSASSGAGREPILLNASVARESLGFRAHANDSGPSLPHVARGISAWSPNRLAITASCPVLWTRATG